jgi:hypothetical protein
MALVAFAVCILVGLQAENTFATIVSNALLAMAVTFVVGLVVGAMAQKMLDENVAAATPSVASPKIPGNSEAKAESGDR